MIKIPHSMTYTRIALHKFRQHLREMYVGILLNESQIDSITEISIESTLRSWHMLKSRLNRFCLLNDQVMEEILPYLLGDE